MSTRWYPVAAFAALLVGLVFFTAPRARATPAAANNATELGRIFAAHFVDAQKGWALADLVAEEPRINAVRTTDGGTTWQILWTFVRETGLEGIWMTSERSGVVSGQGRFFRTTNGGRTWARIRTPYEMSKLSFTGGTGFAIGMPPIKRGDEGPTLLKTTNGGGSWSPAVSQPASVGDYCFSSATLGWVVDGAGMSQTRDGGSSWTQKKPGEGLTAVACHADRYAWGAGGGKVFQTFDDGSHWFEHDIGTRAMITHLVFVDGSNGWAYGERDFRRTVDGGVHWQVLNAAPGPPRFFDAQSGWALDANGELHRTADGGRAWSRVARQTNARTDIAVDLGGAEE